jgi:hypothetical protein
LENIFSPIDKTKEETMSTRTHPATVYYRMANDQCGEATVRFRPDATSTGRLSYSEIRQIRDQLPPGAEIDVIAVGRSTFRIPPSYDLIRSTLLPATSPVARLCFEAAPSPEMLGEARRLCEALRSNPSDRAAIYSRLTHDEQAYLTGLCHYLDSLPTNSAEPTDDAADPSIREI